MTTIKTPEQIEVILNSQEKTVRYARTQIGEGDLMNGKSILDSMLRQIQIQSWNGYDASYEERRSNIL